MKLTPDQIHVFSSSKRWSDVRTMFPTVEDALVAYTEMSQASGHPEGCTHVLKWRLIYQNRESTRKQVFALIFFLFGHFASYHAEYIFETRHRFSPREVARLVFGRMLGSVAYHLCFVGLILVGVGLVITWVMAAFGGVTPFVVSVSVGCCIAIVLLLLAAPKTRSIGLPGPIRMIAKDAFDLASIRKSKEPS